MRGLRCGLALIAVSAALFGACATEQRRPEVPRPPEAAPGPPRTPTKTLPVPTLTPTRGLEESAIGEAPAFASVPEPARSPVPLVAGAGGGTETAVAGRAGSEEAAPSAAKVAAPRAETSRRSADK